MRGRIPRGAQACAQGSRSTPTFSFSKRKTKELNTINSPPVCVCAAPVLEASRALHRARAGPHSRDRAAFGGQRARAIVSGASPPHRSAHSRGRANALFSLPALFRYKSKSLALDGSSAGAGRVGGACPDPLQPHQRVPWVVAPLPQPGDPSLALHTSATLGDGEIAVMKAASTVETARTVAPNTWMNSRTHTT